MPRARATVMMRQRRMRRPATRTRARPARRRSRTRCKRSSRACAARAPRAHRPPPSRASCATSRDGCTLTPTRARARAQMSLHVDMDCVVIMRVPHHADPVNVVARIMHDVDTTRRAKTRFCLRFTPLTRVCRATDDDVEAMARDLLAPFREEAHPPTRFMIVYNARNSQCLKRNDVIKAVARAMGTQHKVDLDKPEVVILVEAIKSMCGIGVVRDYHRYKRFNVVQLLEPAPTAPAAPAASAKRPASPGPSDDEASKRPSTDAVAVPQVAHAL
eukprot:Unigene10495_Nuclearia_a/m.32088 Unigene10495_Nuclearia_a/g.32088  ORF Unigene10495_Nuclearia_a/g.32088 Unigene10495_Nuclearia_a/m.32088 type:complete len:274 (+) Unigene10495_Nuclearia_a:237-1058(+)